LFEDGQEPDLPWVMLTSNAVRAHARAVGSPKKLEALGHRRGGLRTNIQVLVDALGLSVGSVHGPDP
jgi:hypothetical protein